MRQIVLYCLLSLGLIGNVVAHESKLFCGYVERVTLVDKHLTISAKLDSGAKTASLSAVRIRESQQQGKTYLSFLVPIKGKLIPFKAEYAGRVFIKSRFGEHAKKAGCYLPLNRPAVKLKLRLGKQERTIRVNLTNRKRFNYPLLLGRDAIVAFNGVIDPRATFLVKDAPSVTSRKS